MSAQQEVKDSLKNIQTEIVDRDTGIRNSDNVVDVLFIGIEFLTGLVGAIALAALIWAGFRYMTAVGNENQIASAKKVAFWAITGLVVIAGSFFILQFILDIVTAS